MIDSNTCTRCLLLVSIYIPYVTVSDLYAGLMGTSYFTYFSIFIGRWLYLFSTRHKLHMLYASRKRSISK